MKYFGCFIAIVVSVGACSAQQKSGDFSKKIKIPSGYLRLDSIASIISGQSSLRLSMDTREFPPSEEVHLQTGFRPISDVLDDIGKSIGIEYKILGDHVIFIKKRGVSGGVATAPVRQNSFKTGPSAAPQETVGSSRGIFNIPPPVTRILPIPGTPARPGTPLVSRSRLGTRVPEYLDSVKVVDERLRLQSFAPASPAGASPGERGKRGNAGEGRHRLPVLLEAGITANELLYFNPTLKIGVPLFYGIGSWTSNFRFSEFQWGVGTSFRIPGAWKLKIEATTGKLNRSYVYDSLSLLLKAGERIYRVGLLGERQLGSRLKIEAGIGLNVLDTRYSSGGNLAVTPPLNTRYPFDRIRVLNPPYSIIDHAADHSGVASARNTKFWVGMQVGLFYNLNFSRVP